MMSKITELEELFSYQTVEVVLVTRHAYVIKLFHLRKNELSFNFLLMLKNYFKHVESGNDNRERNSSFQSSSLKEAEASHPKKRGMVLPFEPYSLTFDEVVYSVDMPQVILI